MFKLMFPTFPHFKTFGCSQKVIFGNQEINIPDDPFANIVVDSIDQVTGSLEIDGGDAGTV